MDRLYCLKVFTEVARASSFTVAAQRLALSRASVSKHVQSLEKALGAQLLKRTTKQVGLTDAGLCLLESGEVLLDRFEEIEASVRESVAEPRGVVRISAPQSFCTHHLMPVMSGVLQRHPDIQLALSIDDGRASFAGEGIDVMVRIASALEDTSHVAIPLLDAPQVLVASPAYLKRAGRLRSLDELQRHNCLIHTVKSPTGHWRFDTPQGQSSIRVRGSICANFGDVLHQSTLRGDGISIHPVYMVARDLTEGRLVRLLPNTPPEPLRVVALYSSRRHLPNRVRLVLDYLRQWASEPPSWAGPIQALAQPPRPGKTTRPSAR